MEGAAQVAGRAGSGGNAGARRAWPHRIRRRKATALRDRAILELLYAGGLRVSEVTALSTGDLALDAGRVQVRGKGDKERIVPLGRTALEALEQYLREGRPHLERISSARKARRGRASRQDRARLFLSCAACR